MERVGCGARWCPPWLLVLGAAEWRPCALIFILYASFGLKKVIKAMNIGL